MILRALRPRLPVALFLLLALATGGLRAQWLTQSIDLRPGWNAVQFHVDLSHTTLDALIGGTNSNANPIQEVWLWTPATGAGQFVQSPQLPTSTISQWTSWRRSLGAASDFNRLSGPAVCLVRVGAVGTNFTFAVKGRPVAPRTDWTATGLNFLGMPVPSGAGVPFDQFFQPAGQFLSALELYRYGPGELDSGNPARVFSLRTTSLRRGEAFWMRSGDAFNRYFGPVEVVLQDSRGVVFGSRFGEHRLRIRNRANRPVTVRMDLLPSESAPAGQPAIAGTPNLLLRGSLNPTNLLFSHTVLSSTNGGSWDLTADGTPGSDVEVVLGLDRYTMSGLPGALFGGVLRFTDSLGYSQVDLPVSAEVGSWSGLWIGDAHLSQVRNLVNTNDPGTVVQPFPVRLLVHVQGTNAVLLQRVYVGLDAATNRVVATREGALSPAALSGARRLSSVSFPWTESNTPWEFVGAFVHDGSLAATVSLAHDDARSNPFLHVFHPDHDNLDAAYTRSLPAGNESWNVTRSVRIRIRPPGSDFDSLTRSSDRVDGVYEESITLSGRPADSKTYDVSGGMFLRRVSDVPVLTRN